jgi:hypothetical protein
MPLMPLVSLLSRTHSRQHEDKQAHLHVRPSAAGLFVAIDTVRLHVSKSLANGVASIILAALCVSSAVLLFMMAPLAKSCMRMPRFQACTRLLTTPPTCIQPCRNGRKRKVLTAVVRPGMTRRDPVCWNEEEPRRPRVD